MKKQPPDPKKTNPLAAYARYSAFVMQMGIIIVAGAFAGHFTDTFLKISIPVFSLLFSIAAIALAIWLLIKETGKNQKS